MTAKKQGFLVIVILGSLSAIGPFSIDMYLPGFPAIANHFNTTVAHVALSLSSFFIGISFGQLLYGPLLDKYGRLKPLYFGLALYIIASIGCAFAYSTNLLIALRFVQAIGACAGMVASRAMVRDLFPVEDTAKVFSLLMLVIGVSPIVAPTVGGYVVAEFGWEYVFVILAVITSLILFSVIRFLPESSVPDSSMSLRPAPILKSFYDVFKQPAFITYSLAGGIASSGLYAYISGSPLVFIKLYDVTEKQYGWIFGLVAAGLIGSSQLNSLLLRKYKSEKIIVIALLLQSLTGFLLVGGIALGALNLASLIALIFVFLCCQGFTFPNSSALALAPFTTRAGSASALMGALQMAIGACASGAVGVFDNGTAMPMVLVMAICSLSAFSILMAGQKFIKRKAAANIRIADSISMP